VDIVRRELKIPSELAGFGFERLNGIAVQIVAPPFIAIVIQTWVSSGPVQQIELRIVGPGHPGGPAAVLGELSLPGF
jgi:hypothetical protein